MENKKIDTTEMTVATPEFKKKKPVIVVPNGTYNVKVQKCFSGLSKKGDRSIWGSFKILKGQEAGKYINFNYSIEGEYAGSFFFFNKACFGEFRNTFTPFDFVNKVLEIDIINTMDKEGKPTNYPKIRNVKLSTDANIGSLPDSVDDIVL